MLKVLELFSGVGSFSLALKTLGIEHEVVGYSDIRPTAVKLFSKLHDIPESDNLGDVRHVDGTNLDADMITFGSPCQSFTRAGKLGGGSKGSNTASAIMWEAIRIMKETNPKWIIWENVPDAINKRHFSNFEEYMDELNDMGYNTYYELLNANDLGSAQKRKRLFAISIRKDIDTGSFKINKIEKAAKPLSDYLEKYSDDMLEVSDYIKENLILGTENGGHKIKNGTKLGYLIANEGDAVDVTYVTSKTRRGRVQKESVQTIMRQATIATFQNDKLRYLTPLEYWRLQELPEELYEKVLECNFSQSEAYDVIGGAINQLHLKTIFTSLSEEFNMKENVL